MDGEKKISETARKHSQLNRFQLTLIRSNHVSSQRAEKQREIQTTQKKKKKENDMNEPC